MKSAMSEIEKKLSAKESYRQDLESADASVIHEAEVIASNEGRNDCDLPVEEDWDTRVFEGRALMNRRRLQGWTM